MKTTSMLALILMLSWNRSAGQSSEAKQLLLNVEKLAQFKQILSDMKKGYQVLLSGYTTVKELSEGNFSLHKNFLEGLLGVSPAVRSYARTAEIIELQIRLIAETRSFSQSLKAEVLLSPTELSYSSKVLSRLKDQSLSGLEELSTILTEGKLRMNDQQRLSAIDRIHRRMQDKLSFLRYFNSQTKILALQRKKELRDIASFRALYGLPASN